MFAYLDFTNQNAYMEMKEIRRQRLKEWFSDRSVPEAEKSYLSQLMNAKASFGERAARRLEVTYHMPQGYLDRPFDDSSGAKLLNRLDSRQERLLELFNRLPESEKDPHIASLEALVENYDKLFFEMLQTKNLEELIEKCKKKL